MGHPRSAETTGVGAPADDELWTCLRAGDTSALSQLLDRHARGVYNFAFRRTATWSSAEDITQATFVVLWRRAASGSLPALEHPNALPWLLGVADHESRGLLRGAGRRNRLQVRLDSVGGAEPYEADHAGFVSERLDDERRMARVREAIRVLPTHQRVVLELVVWPGLSVAEAASALGVAEGTVKSRLSRARARLGSQLAPDEPEENET